MRGVNKLCVICALVTGACPVLALASGPADSAWPMFGQSPSAQRRTDSRGPTELPYVKWSFQAQHIGVTRSIFYASPSIDTDGTVYAPCQDGWLYAVNPAGQ